MAVSSALLCVYILCNLYNLIWIICPQLGTMYRIIKRYDCSMMSAYTCIYILTLTRYRDHASANGFIESRNGRSNNHNKLSKTTATISTDNFLSVYFDRRHKDLKLLLNLLAETSGLPESFRY